MPTDTTLERRVTDVEAAVAAIQERLASQPNPVASNWLDQFLGAFKDEPAFEEVVAYGRAIRQADRPYQDEG